VAASIKKLTTIPVLKQRQLPEKTVKVPQNGRSFVLYALAAAPRLFPFKEGTVKKIAVYCE
jgi:hypothetical protein